MVKPQSEENLHPPDDFSIERETIKDWVYEKNELVLRQITVIPSLYKIFDKILLHAAERQKGDLFKVSIDPVVSEISVCFTGEANAGDLLLADFCEGSEFLTEVNCSTEFFVEYAALGSHKKYEMDVRNNMVSKRLSSATRCKINEDWTMVRFKPDLVKFEMPSLDEDIVGLMKKRVVDVAFFLGEIAKVELNSTEVQLQSFRDYAEMHLRDVEKSKTTPLPRVYAILGEGLEICVSLSCGEFSQVSFVNGIPTVLGGTHVDCIANLVANHIASDSENLDTNTVKNHLWVFVNALIQQPTFESGSKIQKKLITDSIELKPVEDSIMSKVVKRIGKAILSILNPDEMELQKDAENKKIGKIDDESADTTFLDEEEADGEFSDESADTTFLEAEEAGGEFSQQCTLIIVEGKSARFFVRTGLQQIGQKYYGVYGMTGKPVNPKRNLTKALSNNVANDIIKILGIDRTRHYNSTKDLRYGHLMIMADADTDGSHIKGLIMNLFHSLCCSLLKVPGFLQESITPLLQASLLNEEDKTILFYSVEEFLKWVKSVRNTEEWEINYFKGLASISDVTANKFFKEMFANQTKLFYWNGNSDDDAITMAFSQKKAHIKQRQDAISSSKITRRDLRKRHIRYKRFVMSDLLAFWRANLRRTVPSLVDGFKPSQRKIMHTALRKLFRQPAQVISAFVSRVSNFTSYRHADSSLYGALYGMIQDFVGTGNGMILIKPGGNVGNRKEGRKARPAYRYGTVTVPEISRHVFHVDDDNLLHHLQFAHHKLEPEWFIPIIPLILVNGCRGIGSGWSSTVPTYHPRDIVENIKRLIRNEEMVAMTPWIKGFRGSITNAEEGSYIVRGVVSQRSDKLYEITELPDNCDSIDGYLARLRSKTEVIKSATLTGGDNFIIKVETHAKVNSLELDQILGLTHIISTRNMHLLNAKGDITKYDSPEAILQEFFDLRLTYYSKRKTLILKKLDAELTVLENKLRFAAVMRDRISRDEPEPNMGLDSMKKHYTPMSNGGKEILQDVESATMEDYSYLVDFDMNYCFKPGRQKLYIAIAEKIRAIQNLKEKADTDLWVADLEELEKHLPALENV